MSDSEFAELHESSGGLCLSCGELKHYDCEPDAENYPCDECDAERVMGAENARMMGAIEVVE